MRAAFLLLLAAVVVPACKYKGERFNNGDTWIVRSTFVMRCNVRESGSWSTSVVGCRTTTGKIVAQGETITDGETVSNLDSLLALPQTYTCTALGDGRVEIKRNYMLNNRTRSCEGHKVGESWTSNRNFNKTCTKRGAIISNCLTDIGVTVPTSGKVVLSGIIYSCVSHRNGTVTINREQTPPTPNVGPIPPIEHADIEAKKGFLNKPAAADNDHSGCRSEGVRRKTNEIWIEDEKFTKKCLSDGSVVILNCLVKREPIPIGGSKTIDNAIFKCYRDPEERDRVLFEIITPDDQ